ncbi:uncharacterized protein A4U43_C09F3280, partial [Asparagus officinalis]
MRNDEDNDEDETTTASGTLRISLHWIGWYWKFQTSFPQGIPTNKDWSQLGVLNEVRNQKRC